MITSQEWLESHGWTWRDGYEDGDLYTKSALMDMSAEDALLVELVDAHDKPRRATFPFDSRTYLVGQMLASLFAGGYWAGIGAVRLEVIDEAIRCADLALERMARPVEEIK